MKSGMQQRTDDLVRLEVLLNYSLYVLDTHMAVPNTIRDNPNIRTRTALTHAITARHPDVR